ncbi:hypothetical protein AB0F30_35985 [Streptomyces sp. NPDC029006]|uniref:hypothetical protein n=1 Tax=Streptomyces sp. NPDC029006 TaxID=3155467 RepID=UPI0033D74E3F
MPGKAPRQRGVLIIGGTGSIGRLVAARLLELGRLPRVLTRDPDRARRSLPSGVEVVWEASWPTRRPCAPPSRASTPS